MDADHSRLSWSVQRRLRFIELRLYWEGRINRAALMAFFGISQPQASQDIARYNEVAPGNLAYDKVAKTYVAGADFKPAFGDISADAYLAQLRSIETGGLAAGESWIGRAPAFAGPPRLRRHYDPDLLRQLIRCIHGRLQLATSYLSFSDEAPSVRTIAPHALGFDGQRWHVRAFCLRTSSFRDFVIGRLSQVDEPVPTSVSPEWDLEWTEQVTLKLGVNPALSAPMRQAIERDYLMRQGRLNVTTSICSSYYLESQLNLDIQTSDLPPKRLQLVLLNRPEVLARRAEVQEAAAALIAQASHNVVN